MTTLDSWQLSFSEFEQKNPDLKPGRAKTRWASAVYDAYTEGKSVPQSVLDELGVVVAPNFMPDALASDEVLLNRLSSRLTHKINNEVLRLDDERAKKAISIDRKIKRRGIGMTDSLTILKKDYDALYGIKDALDKLKQELHDRTYNNKFDGEYALELVRKYREVKRGLRALQEEAQSPSADWFVNYTEQHHSGRTTEVKRLDSLPEAKEFASGKMGYLIKVNNDSKTPSAAELVEFFGGFVPSAQEELRIKGLVPGYAGRSASKALRLSSCDALNPPLLVGTADKSGPFLFMRTIDDYLDATKKEVGEQEFTQLKVSLIEEHYQSIENHLKAGGKIDRAVLNSLEPGKQYHFSRKYGDKYLIDEVEESDQYHSYLKALNESIADGTLKDKPGLIEQIYFDTRLSDKDQAMLNEIIDDFKRDELNNEFSPSI